LQLIDVPQASELAAYAVWDPAVKENGIARLALVNTAIRNETLSTGSSDEVITVDVSEFVDRRRPAVRVKRMTGPGADSKDSDAVIWAGQAFTNGTATGPEEVEKPNGGRVTVRGSEGVLVFF
jgi:hypothetical protein